MQNAAFDPASARALRAPICNHVRHRPLHCPQNRSVEGGAVGAANSYGLVLDRTGKLSNELTPDHELNLMKPADSLTKMTTPSTDGEAGAMRDADTQREVAATSLLVALLHACYTGGKPEGEAGTESTHAAPDPISLARLRKLTELPMSAVRRELVNMEADGLVGVTMREDSAGGMVTLTALGMTVCAALFSSTPQLPESPF